MTFPITLKQAMVPILTLWLCLRSIQGTNVSLLQSTRRQSSEMHIIIYSNHIQRNSPVGNRRKLPQDRNVSSSTLWKQLMAGGVSRSLAQMMLYPIDATRTLKQTRDGRTLRDVGASALVRGCTTTSLFALFIGSIQFGVFEGCRDVMGMSPLFASAAGAACSCIVSVPQEVIKQRLVTGIYQSFGEAVGTIYANDGVWGFYNSWKPTMARNVPFVMTTFLTMDAIKSRRLRLKRESGKTGDELSAGENILLGVVSAFVGGVVTNPADVIKTRMMTQSASAQVPYASALDCFTSIVTKEGPLKLYSGFKQRSIYMCSLWGITFALNGKMKEYFNRSRTQTVTTKVNR